MAAACSPALGLLVCFVVCIHSDAALPKCDDSCVDTANRETCDGNLHLLQVGLSMEVKREPRSHLSTLATDLEQTRARSLAAFSKCNGRLSKNSPVVATALDSKYAQLALPWVARMRKLGYPSLVIASLDGETFANMSSSFADDDQVCIVPFFTESAHTITGKSADHPQVHQHSLTQSSASLPSLVGLAKFDTLATLTRLGHECIVSEGDVFLFRSPRDMLQSFDHSKSIVGYPQNHMDSGPWKTKHWGLNIGFVYAKPTTQAISFLEDVAQQWSKGLVKDQSQGENLRGDEEWFNKQLFKQPAELWGLLQEEQDCDRRVSKHLTGPSWRRPKVEIMRDLYAAVVTCRDIELERKLHR